MSFSALTQSPSLGGRAPSAGPVPSVLSALGGTFMAAGESAVVNYMPRVVKDQAYGRRREMLQQRLGKDEYDLTGSSRIMAGLTRTRHYDNIPLQSKMDKLIMEGRKSEPGVYADIQTSAELTAMMKQRLEMTDAHLAETQARYAQRPVAALTGSLAGGMTAMMLDPVNMAASLIPVAGPAQGLKGFARMRGILNTAWKEGVMNLAVEAAQLPNVAAWQNALGRRYGLGEAATELGYAFGGGAALAAILRGAGPAFSKGAESAGSFSQHVFEKIAFSRWAPAGSKDAAMARAIARHMDGQEIDTAQYMARAAHIDESAPPGTVTDEAGLAAHHETVQALHEDFEGYRGPEAAQGKDAPRPRPDGRNQADLDRYAEMLAQARGRSALPDQGPVKPLIQYVRELGGVTVGSPLDADLRALDVNPKTAPGLFKKAGGRGELDNIPASEFEERFGIAPVAGADGYVDPGWLRDRIRAETFGERLGADTTAAEALDDFIRTVEERGVDVATARPEDVFDVLDAKAYQGRQIRAAAQELGETLTGADLRAVARMMDETPDLTAQDAIMEHGERLALLEQYTAPPSAERTEALADMPEPLPEMDRVARARAELDAALQETPGAPVFLEDGRVVTMQDIADMMDQDMAAIEAMTACRLG